MYDTDQAEDSNLTENDDTSIENTDYDNFNQNNDSNQVDTDLQSTPDFDHDRLEDLESIYSQPSTSARSTKSALSTLTQPPTSVRATPTRSLTPTSKRSVTPAKKRRRTQVNDDYEAAQLKTAENEERFIGIIESMSQPKKQLTTNQSYMLAMADIISEFPLVDQLEMRNNIGNMVNGRALEIQLRPATTVQIVSQEEWDHLSNPH